MWKDLLFALSLCVGAHANHYKDDHMGESKTVQKTLRGVAGGDIHQTVKTEDTSSEEDIGGPNWITRPQDKKMYQQLLNLQLSYIDPNTQKQTVLTIPRDADPLGYKFDLSGCGDAWKYLSVSTGYRQEVNRNNQWKVEVWIAPRFLINEHIKTSSRHFQPIMRYWPKNKTSLGIFWTLSHWEIHQYDYLVKAKVNNLCSRDLYKNWRSSHSVPPRALSILMGTSGLSCFKLSF